MIYIITILFTLSFVMYQKYQFIDMKYMRNVKWKTWANVMKVLVFAGCYTSQLFPSLWQDYLLSAAICSLVFEFGYNKIAIKQDWFFNGASSKFDSLGKWKWIALFAFLIISITVKIFV
jgi:hypothetical protein